MTTFQSERSAKEFLAGRILAEAERQGALLSDVERKMLYFSENGWTPPDMAEANAAFGRDYEETAYEEKIAGLVRGIYARDDRTDQEIESWNDACVKLGDGDHYLLVLIDGANSLPGSKSSPLGRLGRWLPTSDNRGKREPGDRLRLLLVALVVFALCALVMVIGSALGLKTRSGR